MYACVCVKRCVDTGPLNIENFFITADTYMRNLYQVDPVTGVTAQLLPFGTASNPVALAYDSTDRIIYWSDVHLHTINRYSLVTKNSSVIYRDPSNTGKDIMTVMDKQQTNMLGDYMSGRVGTLQFIVLARVGQCVQGPDMKVHRVGLFVSALTCT